MIDIALTKEFRLLLAVRDNPARRKTPVPALARWLLGWVPRRRLQPTSPTASAGA
jgi:hypothetical protein